MENNRIATTILLVFVSLPTVKADLVVNPRDTEAVIGDSTYFDCASNVNRNEVHWLYYAVGANDHEDICLYCMGRVHPQYENRIEVETNVTTGNFNLKIKSVRREDAGRYICQDNGGIGESASAQLVILDSGPTCTSNMKPDGVLGPNNCGLEPDTLHLSCHVSYHGNIPPVITWRKSGTEDSVNPLSCKNIDNQMTCNLTMAVDLGLNRASYICETNRSTTTQYNCTTDIIRVIYVKPSNSVQKIVEGAEARVICSVNSSQSCNHTWKWIDEVHEEVVAYGSALVTNKPGWYQCESECDIRGKQCTVLSKLVHVSEPQGLTRPLVITVSLLVTIAAAFGLFFIICLGRVIYLRSRNNELEKNSLIQEKEANKEKAAKEKMANIKASSQEETKQLMSKTKDRAMKLKVLEQRNEEALRIKDLENELIYKRNEVVSFVDQIQKLSDKIKTLLEKYEVSDNTISQLIARVKDLEQGLYPAANIDYADKPTLVRTIITDAARGQHKPINGMTILGKELFVSHDNNSAIEVFELGDSKAFQFSFWDIEGKPHPMDIASCTIANCLYIVVREDSESESQIMKLEPRGQLLQEWPTGGDTGRLSTYKSNVIVCLFEKSLINEFSGDGKLIHTVRLSPGVGFNHLWHAIKVTSSHFAVCHGEGKDELHRVCIVNVEGNIIKELIEWKTKDSRSPGKLNVPICIVEDSERSILVADRDNQMVRLMNGSLKHQKNLLKKEMGLDGYPVRICLDETKGRLFVAVKKKSKDDRILIFNIT